MKHKTLVIGHRGAMGYKTENTLASVQEALRLDVDMIEIDVFKIKSGEIMVFHDDKIDRLTNGEGAIEALDFYQVYALVLEGGYGIPELKDVLDLVDKKCQLNIELKGAGTAKPVYDLLNTYIRNSRWEKEDFLISSFNWEELNAYRELDKEIRIGVLIEEKDPLLAIPEAEKLKAFSIHPDFNALDKEVVSKIKAAGFEVYTWTVNERKDIKKMKNFKVDGIISNYPDRIT